MDIGNERVPTIEKLDPDKETWETLRAVVPGLLRVTVCCAALPTVTAPNGTGLGFTTICVCPVVPVPDNLTIVGVGEASLMIANVLLTGPGVVGTN